MIRFCIVAVLLIPAAAMAQGNPGPFGGLFGRAPARAGQDKTTVEIRSGLGAQYDTALLPPEEVGLDLTPRDLFTDPETQSGMSAGAVAGIVLDHSSSNFNVNVRGAVTRGQYFVEPNPYGTNLYNVAAQTSTKPTDRFDVNAAASYLHSPYYSFFPQIGGSALPVDNSFQPYSPYAAVMTENDTIEFSAGMTAHLFARSSLTLAVNQRRTQFPHQPQDDYLSNGYRASWGMEITKDLGVHAGYGREFVDQRGDGETDYDNEMIDIGVDYTKAFSIARRTTFGFSTSTSVVRDTASNSRLRVNGSANLSKLFRRTWSATVQASRETSFVPGFIEPLFSDSVGVTLSGMFSRRIDWMANAAAGRGQYAFSGTEGFGTVSASTRMGYALSKNVSAYGQYIAYWHEVPPRVIGLDLPGRMARQVVAVGLGFYLPVYEKVRQAP